MKKKERSKAPMICAHCLKSFIPRQITAKTRFCSRRCTSRATRPTATPIRTCHTCKKKFKRPNALTKSSKSGRLFCSRPCSNKGRVRPKRKGILKCQHCKKTKEVRRNSKTRYCSNACAGFAKRSKNPSNPRRLESWGRKVRRRDGYKCVRCGETKGLHAHHKKSFAKHSRFRYAMSNGETLCVDCHADEHPEMAHLIRKLPR